MPSYDNQLEPAGMVGHFLANPPEDFEPFVADSVPGFLADFDLLTTVDRAVRQKIAGLPCGGSVLRLLRFRTCFFGTTVSEYLPFPAGASTAELPQKMLDAWRRRSVLLIAKDIPEESPLLPATSAAGAKDFLAACKARGFIVLQGQALAFVTIDFGSEDEYLLRQSSARRKNIRRKLRSRADLGIEILPTGDPRFADEAFLAVLYTLYLEVYAQSELHFDLLSANYFRALLQDASLQGRLFLYHADAQLIGYNLCFIYGGMLVDKYVGFRYPAARNHNLYFVSWMENLAYALQNGLTHYIAGWTDPEVKAALGAKFTFTHHAVYVRNPVLRAILRGLSHHFEGDRSWFENHAPESQP